MSHEIKITYTDGAEKTGIVNVFPQNQRCSIKIPLVQIRKYVLS